MVSTSPYSGDLLSIQLMPPVVPPLEPLPLDALSPFEMRLQRAGAYRRRCTTALAMLGFGGGDGGAMSRADEDDDELHCRYPSKLCHNTRVRKASGALHRYCAHHRDKANANQKRWVSRQRSAETASLASSSTSSCSTASLSTVSSPFSSASSSPLSVKSRWMAATSFDEPSASVATLSDDEWDALLVLLVPSSAATSKTLSPTMPRSERQRPVAAASRRRRWNGVTA